MRFIFGLVAGALATLFVAAAFDAPADHLVGKLVHTTARLSDRLVETDIPDVASVADEVESLDPVESLSEEGPVSEVPEPEAPAAKVPEPEAPAAKVSELEVVAEPEVPQPESAHSAIVLADNETVSGADSYPDEVPQMQQQAATAWGPFHSEASANGFARRLSRETGRPFAVEKRGPGQYAVTFVYAGEADLSAMREQIADVTGIPQT